MQKKIIFIIVAFLIFISCKQKNQNQLESQVSKTKSVLLDTIPKEKYRIYRKDTIIDYYRFEIEFISENDDYEGKTKFTIRKKETNELVQIIYSDRFVFNNNFEIWYKEDMNFDGYKDLIFYNGNHGGYGTMTYDYYLYNPNTQTFVFNKQLLEMGSFMGLDLDKENQQIITYAKSGCCWHGASIYIAKGQNFIEVENIEEDFVPVKIGRNDYKEKIQITIKKLKNGKWQKQVYLDLSKEQQDSLWAYYIMQNGTL